MSSTISTTEIQTIPPRAVTKLKTEEKPHRLVRTSSIEKIRRFNTFICSQQYYLLPALLSWLRSSQSGLHSSTEKTIFLFRSIIFNNFFYKLYKLGFRSLAPGGWSTDKARRALAAVISNFYEKFTKCFESTFLLAIAAYTACGLVIFQLFLALYLMCFAFLPYGFLFMTACMVTIKYLCYRTMFFFITSSAKRDIRCK